jgi:hypothetical protein
MMGGALLVLNLLALLVQYKSTYTDAEGAAACYVGTLARGRCRVCFYGEHRRRLCHDQPHAWYTGTKVLAFTGTKVPILVKIGGGFGMTNRMLGWLVQRYKYWRSYWYKSTSTDPTSSALFRY